MDTLAKMLFPHHPKLVRLRKLQAFYLAVLLSVASCVATAVTVFLMNQVGQR
jgi:hypothetical protein